MTILLRNAAAVMTAAGLCTVLAACGDSRASSDALMRKPVIVTTVHARTLSATRTLTATVRARVESDIGFRAAGKVVERLVDVGDIVKTGQPIGRLDVADYTLGVDAALDQLRAATVEAEQAASDEGRMSRLLSDGSVGIADHERQKARADAASARLDQASRALELARNRAGYTTLLAPYAGVITGMRMEVGQVVAEGQPVVSLAGQGERELVADLPEGLIGRVRELRASATLWQGQPEPLALEVREVSPAASATTGTFRVRYAVLPPAAANGLILGSTARLSLEDSAATGIELPVSAMATSGGTPGVWIVDAQSGNLRFSPVQVLTHETDTVRVAGLEDGLKVVTVGAQKLDASLSVTPIERRSDAIATPGRSP